MGINDYAMEELARSRIAEFRAAAARHALARGSARPLRVAIGLALNRLGARALGDAGVARALATRSG